MTSNQPYLLKALHQWILDNNMTPHIVVSADIPSIKIPQQSVEDGKIVLNIAPQAISNMVMDNESVSFTARFSGVSESLYIPIQAIRAIYASENGEGMVFPEYEDSGAQPQTTPTGDKTPPFLKVVK